MTSVEKRAAGAKRPAFEIPAELAKPPVVDVRMRRPVATAAGAALVLLRVLAGVVWLISLALQWPDVVSGVLDEEEIELSIEELGAASDAALVMVLILGGLLLLIDLVLAVLIYLGLNWPRIVVMVLSTLSISGAFATWWAGDQEITLQTTLLTLSLDILVMLALSSRAARAYARRPRLRD
jgi:hypothetical protein